MMSRHFSNILLSGLVLSLMFISIGCHGQQYDVEEKRSKGRLIKIYRYKGIISRTEIYEMVDAKQSLKYVIFWENDGRLKMISLKSEIPKGRHQIQFYKQHKKIEIPNGPVWQNYLDLESSVIPEYWNSVRGTQEHLFTQNHELIFSLKLDSSGTTPPILNYYEDYVVTDNPSQRVKSMVSEIIDFSNNSDKQ